MSETPRTDTAIKREPIIDDGGGDCAPIRIGTRESVPVEFARTLERELNALQAPASLPPEPPMFTAYSGSGRDIANIIERKHYDTLRLAASQLAAQVGALRNPTDEQLTAAVIAWFGTTANPPPIVDDDFKDRMRAAINALAGEGK